MEHVECLSCKKKHVWDVFNPFCPDCGEPMVFCSSSRKRTFALDKKLYLENISISCPSMESSVS